LIVFLANLNKKLMRQFLKDHMLDDDYSKNKSV
jgi:hypothetical protein